MSDKPKGSPPNKFDKDDANAALKIAFIAGASAFVQAIVEYLKTQDFDQWTPAVIALLTVISTAAIRWKKDNTKANEK